MALWTPYSEQALDLRKNVHERISPKPSILVIPEARPYVYTYNAITPPEREYQANIYVTMPQPSPDSRSMMSWSSCSKTTPSPSNSPENFEVDLLSEDVEYQAFERNALRAMAEKSGGTLLCNNPRMRRAVQTNHAVDESYKKQRERNNFAAKQSRDRRKLREVRLAFKVTYLQKKLTELRAELGGRRCARCQYY